MPIRADELHQHRSAHTCRSDSQWRGCGTGGRHRRSGSVRSAGRSRPGRPSRARGDTGATGAIGPVNADRTVLLLPRGLNSARSYGELMAQPEFAAARLVAATLPGNAGTPPPDASASRTTRGSPPNSPPRSAAMSWSGSAWEPVLRSRWPLRWVAIENLQLSGLPPSQGGLSVGQVRGALSRPARVPCARKEVRSSAQLRLSLVKARPRPFLVAAAESRFAS
jgi:hypothetical protein